MYNEVMLMGVDELVNFSEASKHKEWRIALEQEIEVVEWNETWVFTELPDGLFTNSKEMQMVRW